MSREKIEEDFFDFDWRSAPVGATFSCTLKGQTPDSVSIASIEETVLNRLQAIGVMGQWDTFVQWNPNTEGSLQFFLHCRKNSMPDNANNTVTETEVIELSTSVESIVLGGCRIQYASILEDSDGEDWGKRFGDNDNPPDWDNRDDWDDRDKPNPFSPSGTTVTQEQTNPFPVLLA